MISLIICNLAICNDGYKHELATKHKNVDYHGTFTHASGISCRLDLIFIILAF